MANKVLVATYDAVGGPKMRRREQDGFWAGPTDAGTYVMHRCGKHSSRTYAAWSKIPWGSQLKEEDGQLLVMYKGKWTPLEKITPVRKKDILDYHEKLYGTRKIPETWIFNDFGHKTCYFFKDKNKNRRLDRSKGERIHPEYFHTTPPNEAEADLGEEVDLQESHGCIHLKPGDIDVMTKRGYMKRGTKVVIHSYTGRIPGYHRDPHARGPYEVHFYPGIKKVAVIGRPAR